MRADISGFCAFLAILLRPPGKSLSYRQIREKGYFCIPLKNLVAQT
jgi:hypothetical protein